MSNRRLKKAPKRAQEQQQYDQDLDAAIALLSRVRALASSDDTNTKAVKPTSTGMTARRTLSTEAREAIAAAQRKRWAKVRRQKKQARRAAVAK